MLEDILNSKSDAAVLSFFLAAPERSFSPVEIAKRLGVPYLKTVRTLNKLVLHGQLKSFSKKGKKYYLVNSRYKLLPAIKDFLLKNGPKYQDELYSAIRNLGEVKAAYLSGLFVGQPTLPVDILIVGKVSPTKLENFLKHLEIMMDQEINYSIMTEQEFKERKGTFDRFIKDIFDYKHLVVCDNLKK
jgi:hypothetical protein